MTPPDGQPGRRPLRLVHSARDEAAPVGAAPGGGRVAVIGGGFYGCHLAATLIAAGFEVTVLEASDRLLGAASGANQFRLHQGFHYARSHPTRMQSRDGFRRFIQHYPELTETACENIYAVATDESLLDYETYRLIMEAAGLSFEEIERASVPITGVSGMMRTDERVFLVDRARDHFHRLLAGRVVTGRAVRAIRDHGAHVDVDGERFDHVIDATWGHFRKPPAPVFYEPTLMLYYETDDPHPAVTMVDGPLYSVYPTQDRRLFTLSSVTETPLGRFDSAAAARARRDATTSEMIAVRRANMERQIRKFLPEFAERFRYVEPQLSLKTKLVGPSDNRSCAVFAQGRVLSVVSGKIDAAFHAAEDVLRLLGVSQPGAVAQAAARTLSL